MPAKRENRADGLRELKTDELSQKLAVLTEESFRLEFRRATEALTNQLQRIRERLGRAAEFEPEALLRQHRQLLRQLVGLELAQSVGPVFPFRRHTTAPPASRTSIAPAAWRTRAPGRRGPRPLRCPRART